MGKAIAKLILAIIGWKVVRPVPKEYRRCMMTAAPHTSNWDGLLTRLAFYILDVPVKIAIKDDWTKMPVVGPMVRYFGGLGINRSKKDPNKPRKSQVEQMADFFKKYDEMALVIAPEGTRSLRKEWKMGFYYAAKMANVPITYGYLDYAKKEAGVGGPLYPTDNIAADMKHMMDFYRTKTGKYPENFMLDQRYS